MLKNVNCEYDRWVVETQLCKLRDTSDTLVGIHIQVNIVMKPTNSPTQGQPNPTSVQFADNLPLIPSNCPKNGSVVPRVIGPLFPTADNFSRVGIGVIYETAYKKPNPTKFSANTLSIRVFAIYQQIILGWKHVTIIV